MIKSDLHIHTEADPNDGPTGCNHIKYTAKDVIDKAARLGFGCIAFTCHDYVHFNKDLDCYARRKGVVLIPGSEMTIQGKHVLALGLTESDRQKVKTFSDLEYLRNQNALIVAPHPFGYLSVCLKDLMEEYKHLFDAVELNYFNSFLLNCNRKAERFAIANRLPLVSNSDTHKLYQFGRDYSVIDAEDDRDSILEALRKGKVRPFHRPLSTAKLVAVAAHMASDELLSLF